MGNLFGGKSAKKAAAQVDARSQQGANDILATNTASNAPLMTNANFANQAMTPLGQLLGLNGYNAQAGHDAVTNNAGYKYGLQQAQANMDGSAAARGALMSGQTLLGQADLGNRYYQDARNNEINHLMNMYGVGNGLLGQIAANNNNAAANAAQMRVGGAQAFANQRQQAYQNNLGAFTNLLTNGASAGAGYTFGGS